MLKLHVRKQTYKFSAAHWTMFPDGTKEALHGHNYQVAIDVELRAGAEDRFLDFRSIKDLLRPICEGLDEKVLLAASNPKIQRNIVGDEVEVRACGKRYVFPLDEVVALPVANITTEELASWLAKELVVKIGKQPEYAAIIARFEVNVEESSGQGATYAIPC